MDYFKKIENIKHVIVFGKQGTGKDLLIVSWLTQFNEQGTKIYSNSELKFSYEEIKSVKDISDARDGYLYLHDIDLLFNSRDFMLKKNQDKQETLLHLVNNMRKHGLTLIASCHRPKNIDVKLRTLIGFWVQPRMIQIGPDKSNLWDWIIIYDVFDEFNKFSHSARLDALPMFAVNYDTYDCVRPLVSAF